MFLRHLKYSCKFCFGEIRAVSIKWCLISFTNKKNLMTMVFFLQSLQVEPTLFYSSISSETKFTARFLILWYFLAAIILRWNLSKFQGALDFGMRRQTNILSTSFVFSPVFITFKMRCQTIRVHFLLSVYPLFGIGAKPQIMLKSTSY